MEEQSTRQQRIELFASMLFAFAGLATAWSTHADFVRPVTTRFE